MSRLIDEIKAKGLIEYNTSKYAAPVKKDIEFTYKRMYIEKCPNKDNWNIALGSSSKKNYGKIGKNNNYKNINQLLFYGCIGINDIGMMYATASTIFPNCDLVSSLYLITYHKIYNSDLLIISNTETDSEFNILTSPSDYISGTFLILDNNIYMIKERITEGKSKEKLLKKDSDVISLILSSAVGEFKSGRFSYYSIQNKLYASLSNLEQAHNFTYDICQFFNPTNKNPSAVVAKYGTIINDYINSTPNKMIDLSLLESIHRNC